MSAPGPRRRTARRRTASVGTPIVPSARPIHLVPRSVLALAPALVPDFDPFPAEVPAPRRPPVRRRLAAFVVAALFVAAVAVAFAGSRIVLAQFVATATVTSNTFATGAWATTTTWYLHNNPSPPTANTTAQLNLPLDATAPTAATLYNYDTNCESRAGRSINRNTGLVTETGACRYATWRSAALAGARTLNGTATLSVWARKTSTGGTNPTLRAFLRVFDPGTSTYTDLGAANATVTAGGTSAWARLDLAWALSSVGVPAGRRIEIKLVATGGTRNVEIAYDTTTLASSLTLP